MPEHKLEADSIIYNIANRQLLTDIYLSCETGEIVGLLGRNGSGKSTLLRIIFGTQPTANKHIRVNGTAYQAPYKHRNLVAYLPQHSFLPDNLRLHKIIELYFQEPDKRKAIQEHERTKPHLNKFPDELSKGELRYFELLLLLQKDVKFLLLDEPFSGIEPIYTDRILELLEEHLSTKGFIITDHNYSTVVRISDRVVLLTDGACRSINNPEELVEYGYVPASAFS
ncbi:ATP-binding cassette domain-containing protein [Pontibacter burrus]|uniref:ATP-binding cassette domain-containing protein n=1 Tax=Pontibacter burrus TaxID=2704466 RepID=A0A6B3LRQ4_9BACT|nr:ATP-binding cassette domain-containing protein [Pontibacter burrus]NEM99522.1 ATP-binding cassette domain-containing protein [Pontibacter burrus]